MSYTKILLNQKMQAQMLILSGNSLSGAEKITGISSKTIATFIKKNGISLLPSSRLKYDEDIVEKAAQYYIKGNCLLNAAFRFNVSKYAISKYLKDNSIMKYPKINESSKTRMIKQKPEQDKISSDYCLILHNHFLINQRNPL